MCDARIDLLFTMSDNAHPSAADRPDDECENSFSADEVRAPINPAGGARRDRTDDLLLAKQALSQLSYGPSRPGINGQ